MTLPDPEKASYPSEVIDNYSLQPPNASYLQHGAVPPTPNTPAVAGVVSRTPVSNLARRVHGWSFQAVSLIV
jgi:hypothetical protein